MKRVFSFKKISIGLMSLYCDFITLCVLKFKFGASIIWYADIFDIMEDDDIISSIIDDSPGKIWDKR